MDGHPALARGWTESRLQAGSPSTRAFRSGGGQNGPIVAQFPLGPSNATTCEYGTGGISWIGPTKVQLRIWVPTENDRRRETKVVKVPDREHGGRGKAKEELEKFIAEVAQRASVPTGPTVTVADMLDAYLVHCKRIGRTQSTIESYEHATRRVPATLGALPLAKLTSRDLDAFCGDLAERLADNTIRQTHAILTAALEQAMKWGRISGPTRERTSRTSGTDTNLSSSTATSLTHRGKGAVPVRR